MAQMLRLPIELLESIFSFVESAKDIVSLSETCILFNQIITRSDKLTSKLTLYVNYPLHLESFATIMRISERKYRNLKITRSRERYNNNVDPSPSRIFESVAPYIRHLEFNWANSSLRIRENALVDIVVNRHGHGRHFDEHNPFHRMLIPQAHIQQAALVRDQQPRHDSFQEFVNILQEFKNLRSMKWLHVHLERNPSPITISLSCLSSVRELTMKHCDAQCFEMLNSCNQLIKLDFQDPFWISTSRNPGIESLERFLIQQDSLKYLRLENIQYSRLFQSDYSEVVNFKLNHLILKNVFFKDNVNAEKFFQTQNQLQTIEFQVQNEKVRVLHDVFFYNKILKIIFSQNPSLYSVKLEKIKYKIDDFSFLDNIQNPSVRELTFNVTAEDKDVELFKAMNRMFSNLTQITFSSEESEDTDSCKCFDAGTNLDKLKSLTILNSSVRSLVNVYAANLQEFEYAPGKTGEYIDDFVGGFLHRHRSIKRLVIGSKTARSCSYFFVSFNLCQVIVNFLHQLESIVIFNFAEVNKSVKLLCSLHNLKSLTLSSAQYQQFTAKTKVECDRMNVRLIPVIVETPKETSNDGDF